MTLFCYLLFIYLSSASTSDVRCHYFKPWLMMSNLIPNVHFSQNWKFIIIKQKLRAEIFSNHMWNNQFQFRNDLKKSQNYSKQIYNNRILLTLLIFLRFQIKILILLTVCTYLEWNSVASFKNKRPGCVSTTSWIKGTKSSGTR